MKFRIDKETETFKRLEEVFARMDDAHQKAWKLAEELGGTGTYLAASGVAAGGLSGIKMNEKPEGWKAVFAHRISGFFFPKVTKANRAILGKIATLPTIKRQELNEVVGFNGPQLVGDLRFVDSVGLRFRDDFFLLEIAEDARFTPNADMVEITMSEWKRLKGGEE